MLGIIKSRPTGTSRELARLVEAYAAAGRFTGAVLVAKGGDVLLRRGYGPANRETGTRNTPATPFRIGSLTKPFTALAVMRLVERGELDVGTPLATYLPDHPGGRSITLHHLLSNTSGVPDYVVLPEYAAVMRNPLTHADLLALFRDRPAVFEPGAGSGYSNSNWILLGIVLERVTGRRYADVVRDLVFAPAGMTASGYDWEEPLVPGRADGYVDTGNGVRNAMTVHETGMDAAGALYSTVDDLQAWDRALRAGAIVAPQTWTRMTTPVQPAGDYGYGWELHRLHGRPAVGHAGGIPGFLSNYVQLGDSTIILLSNLGAAALPELTRDLAAVLVGAPYALPARRTFVDVDPSVLTPYIGTFRMEYSGRVSTLVFDVEDGRLVMNVAGLPRSVLSPMAENRFYGRSKGEVELTFVRAQDGPVQRIDLCWAGHELHATRLG